MVEINNKTRSKINLSIVKKITESFLKFYKKEDCIVSIAFVSDAVIQRLNKQYRNIDKITDILSFSGNDEFLGEVVIDYAQIKRQAIKFETTIKQELIFILVHGLLHLIGYNDDTEVDAKKMDKLTNKFIKNL